MPDSLKSFQKSFFLFISVFEILFTSKRRETRFPVFFSDSLSASLYIRQSAYIFADCKRLRKMHKIGNDFSGFSKCSDLISEQVKRNGFDFWITAAFSLSLYMRGFHHIGNGKQTTFRKSFKFFLLTKYSGWFSLKSINGIQAFSLFSGSLKKDLTSNMV